MNQQIADATFPCLAEDCDSSALVILVHGTYAGDSENAGQKWWQAGSTTVSQLRSRLPRGVKIAEGSEVFHWSGENSERARSKAGRQLLERLRTLEGEQRDYHLVGHSHGGSVIWKALKAKALSQQPLEHLKSWTTVGTPYLEHRSRSVFNIWNIAGVVMGILLIPPAARAMLQLGRMLTNAFQGNDMVLTLPPASEAGLMGIIRAPILSSLEWVGVQVERSVAGVHIGSYDPDTGRSLLEYLFGSFEGILLMAVTLTLSYVLVHLSMISMRPAIESYRIRAEERLQRSALEIYGNRYLAIWSPDDEAINGLRATLGFQVSFVSKMFPQERVFFSDTLGLLSRPYYWVLSPIFNRWLQPSIDRLVRNAVTRSAQGNDRPSSMIVAVTPSPVPELSHLFPPLPAPLSKRILCTADHHAKDIAPMLRKLLGQASLAQGVEGFCNELSGKELVHTSYFDHSAVMELISCNITWSMGEEMVKWKTWRMDPELTRWFSEAKRNLMSEFAYGGDKVDEWQSRHVSANAA
ncbi:MAG: hypothetical protein L7W43_12385 [Rubripirellula sp.]|nr:hypothetical protein [Rhodopirellula sp.]MCH1440450.1 hypothetical protein [Rubripirellula sp.]OUX06240.1 MAG: hypothetical protein CBE00_08195 [Planctomycetaceae bacterium TMED240]